MHGDPYYAAHNDIPDFPEAALRTAKGVLVTVQVGLRVSHDARRKLPYRVHTDLDGGDYLELAVYLGDSSAKGLELPAFRCGIRLKHLDEDLDMLFSSQAGRTCDKLRQAEVLGQRDHMSLRNAASAAAERCVKLATKLHGGA